MAERSLIFPAAEYRRRIAALQSEMVLAKADALLLTTPADVFYVTGFLTRFWESPARPWYLIVPSAGDPIAVIPAIGGELMGRTWVDDVRTWDAPDPHDDGVSLLVDVLNHCIPEKGALAVPKGLETQIRMPVADYERVAELLGNRRVVDGTAVIQRVREIKSELEIDKIRDTCRIADAAFSRVPEFAATGVTLAEVFRRFQITLLEEGADWVSYVAGAAGPGGYGDVISPADERPLQSGDVLMIDTGAVKEGYFCDFDRNYAVGDLGEATIRVHEALHQATDAALRDLRPGMLACDVHKLLTDTLRGHGVTPGGGRLGHGLGLTLTEWPSFTPKDQTELRAGMVLTLEPGAEVSPGRLLVHEENIVLRDGGAELLSTRAPTVMHKI